MAIPHLQLSSEDWRRMSALLDELMELPESEQESWRRRLADADPAMSTQVEAFLAAEGRAHADGFLDEAVITAPMPLAGRQVGAYRLVSPIGEGGMGAVWLAERTDGRFEGRVAIKLLHAGLLRPADAERFRREGSLLARLSHPNIARLLDAGVVDRQPYLVLEFIEGQPIDQSCDARRLDTRARVRLFLQVLDAVSHAHARLVLHRDVKPSNVLVDTDGRARLIDFGVAKLVEGDAEGAGDLTREMGRAFTPAFAAPEQMAGETVSTSTDVYSLGLLLYLLLTGQNPRAGGGPQVGAQSPMALASHTVKQAGRDAQARELTGDLDNILAKALKPLPAERYATAEAFAEDLRRYLRGDTVSARPDTFGYRVSRFVGRHRVAVGASAAALVAILGLAGAAVWQAREAGRQRAQAERQAEIAVARGAAAYAVAQSGTRIDRALLLGVEGVERHLAPETSVGLLSAMEASRQLRAFHRHLGANLRALAVADDRRSAVTIDAAGLVRRWTLPGWTLSGERHTGAKDALVIEYRRGSRDLLISAGTGGLVLDATSLGTLHTIAPVVTTSYPFTELSEDGTIAIATAYGERTVRVTDPRTGASRLTFTPRGCQGAGGAIFIPGRREMALPCQSGLYIYDLETGAPLRARPGSPLSGMEMSRNGRHALVGGLGNDLSIMDIVTLTPVIPEMPLPGGRLYSSRFSRSGAYLVLGTDTGWVAVWDVANRREIMRFGGLEDGVFSIGWVEDEFTYSPETGISGRAVILAVTPSGAAEWDLSRTSSIGTPTRTTSLPDARGPDQPLDVARGVAFVRVPGASREAPSARVNVVSLVDGRTLRSFTIDAADIGSLNIDASGRQLFAATLPSAPAGNAAAELLIVDANTGKTIRRLDMPTGLGGDLPHTRVPGVTARFSSDGLRLAAVANGRLAVWAVDTGRVVGTASVPRATQLVAWSANDQVVATVREFGLVALFDSATLRQTGSFEHSAELSIKQAFPSARLGGIVMTSEGGETFVLDPHAKKAVGEPFRAGGSQLQASAVSPDGRYLASTSSDGLVRVWDVATRVPVGPPLQGHPAGRVYNRIWFSSNTTLSTYTPGLKIDWNLDMREAARRTCERVARALTPTEWRQFVGEVHYSPACKGP